MSLRYTLCTMTKRHEPPTAGAQKVPAKDAAKMLGVSLRTLDRYQADGKITPCPVPIKPRQFKVEDLERLKVGA